MNIATELNKRSDSKCELCGATENLNVFEVPPVKDITIDNCIYACSTCQDQINNPETMDANHWRCLNDSMWSEEPAVKVMAWRLLNRLKAEGWPQDLLDMLYLDEETQAWAESTGEGLDADEIVKHMDSNGVELFPGDSIVLIKDLKVRGTSMVAKRGTAVRNISLVKDNPEHIEGKVEGQQIVILTQYVKK